jgi:hypothetical protein
MIKISETIAELKALDLSRADSNQIKNLLKKLSNIIMLGIEIPVDDFIIRGVLNSTYERRRYYEYKISYMEKHLKSVPFDSR